ncbi:DUF5677 domain-containing protein [Citrobacter freundii]|uniref:DUF5677 domain-containing protein n=1 Tax=Citrobacter freundii TaxID=546 RepID=UPI000A3BE91C|nr:DUF5677 domain-containing protein [Citrobacter freundii]AYL56253.1 hypothetical protein CUC48_06500 [Citrobacter freundii]EJC6095346.1 hypothetical protein [Citrobacter freundii]EKV1033163.1 hypothetical protein [Citrobacter freundii]EKW5569422.1 hypothetical protein [Citrobacter freundii]EKX6741937.1 hypothetical protein [Citrobacter freundii]
MTSIDEQEHDINNPHVSMEDFYVSLRKFDVAVCEACAVSQGIGVQIAEAYIAYTTQIFARMCIHAQILISNVPESRWAKKDYPFWDLSLVASHARALLEAELLFYYLSKENSTQEEWSAKLNIMHMNDCAKRIEFFNTIKDEKQVEGFEAQKAEIATRLESNDFFNSLDSGTRKRCLSGKALMIPNRDELLIELKQDPKEFRVIFDLLSHYTHILPISYYRMEANGRGTGSFNETDLSYITLSLNLCHDVIVKATDKMVVFFPETLRLRKGLRSKFSFGPKIKK